MTGVSGTLQAARFEWCLVSFGAGIAAYFTWPHEPRWAVSILVFGLFLLLLLALRRRARWYDILLLCVFCLAGFSRSVLHAKSASAPILPEYRKSYLVTGWVEKIDQAGSLQRFYIKVAEIEGMTKAQTPVRIRVRIKPRGIVPGDSIKLKALMKGPPGPAIVGGYDPARAAYFKQIGGYGFAISKPEKVDLADTGAVEVVARKLVTFRYRLSRHIQARAPPRTAGLQAALLTGDRSALDKAQEQSLRDAGLAHLLAISGLHMGLLAGGAYYLASLLLSMIGPLARRYDMRKGAAVIGALFAIGYLLISGASVSTQRAFIMAIVVFAAVILDRRALSMRSVTLAAAITLMLHPESLISAGFQMSFAATAALIAVYSWWSARRQFRPGRSFFRWLWNGFVGVSITSLVAGAATGGFAALHFHRFARLGFFANLAAMPVFTLIVMPAGFLAVLLIPLGLDQIPLKVMGLGLDFVLMVSDWISAQKGALTYIKGANGFVTSIFGLGFVWLCLGPRAARWAGGGIMACALVLWGSINPPDMRVSSQGRVAYWDENSENVLRVDWPRGDKFGRERFTEQAGYGDGAVDLRTYTDKTSLCDQQACRFNLKGARISIVLMPEGVSEACRDSDLVILTLRSVGPRARRLCKAILLDGDDLRENGGRDINISNGDIVLRPINPNRRKARPWGH